MWHTVEPPNKGHFRANSFVPCREVVPISEGPLSEVPLYTYTVIISLALGVLYTNCPRNQPKELTLYVSVNDSLAVKVVNSSQ